MVNKPKIEKGKVLGRAEIGTFAGTRTGEDGVTEKVIVDDIVTSGPLTVPEDIDSPVLIGGVRITTTEDVDYTPKQISPNRVRTFEKVIRSVQEPLKKVQSPQ